MAVNGPADALSRLAIVRRLFGPWAAVIGGIQSAFGLWSFLAAAAELQGTDRRHPAYYLPDWEWWRWAIALLLSMLVIAIVNATRLIRDRDSTIAALQNADDLLLESQIPTYSAETLATAETQWRSLSNPEKEAVRQLLIQGELTEKQAVRHLQEKRIANGMQSVFWGIAARTSLVQRTFQGTTGKEHVHGYTGTYRVNPALRESLMEIIKPDGAQH